MATKPAIKTNWTEINQIIKEEFQRLMEKNKLKKRVQQINEELGKMESEDQELDEVKFGGMQKTKSDTGLEPNVQPKPEFTHKGSHLLEDEDEDELDIEDAGEEGSMENLGGIEASSEEGEEGEEGIEGIEGIEGEEEEEGGLNLAAQFAELGATIEARIKAALGGGEEIEVGEEPIEGGAVEGGEEFEEVGEKPEGFGSEPSDEASEESEEESEEGEEEEKKEVPMMQESKKIAKKVITEVKKSTYLNILSEGLDTTQKSALQNEVDRMRRLAKLDNND